MEILYFVAGMFFQRILIIFAVKNISPTICDYCRWVKINQWRWIKTHTKKIKPPKK